MGARSCCRWGGTAGPYEIVGRPGQASFAHWPKALQGKLLDVELSIRGILRGYGLKVGEVRRGRFEARIQGLIVGHTTLSTVIGGMLAARAQLSSGFTKIHREMLRIARADRICQRLMSTPGVGALSR